MPFKNVEFAASCTEREILYRIFPNLSTANKGKSFRRNFRVADILDAGCWMVEALLRSAIKKRANIMGNEE